MAFGCIEKIAFVVAAGIGGAFLGTSQAKALAKLRRITGVAEGADVPKISMPGLEHVLGVSGAWMATQFFVRGFIGAYTRPQLFAALGVCAVWYTVYGRVVLCDHYNPRTKIQTTAFKPLYFAYTGNWSYQIERTSTTRTTHEN